MTLFLYATYLAFAIRRALATKIYRRQSLWVGLIGVYFAGIYSFPLVSLFLDLRGSSAISRFSDFPGVEGWLFFVLVGPALLFAWTDSTVQVARKSDPLARRYIALEQTPDSCLDSGHCWYCANIASLVNPTSAIPLQPYIKDLFSSLYYMVILLRSVIRNLHVRNARANSIST